MAYAKWIGAWLGWINSQSVLGTLAGFALGAVFDMFTDRRSKQSEQETYQQQTENIYQQEEGARNSFLFSLMLFDKDSEVIISNSGYACYKNFILAAGATPVNVCLNKNEMQ